MPATLVAAVEKETGPNAAGSTVDLPITVNVNPNDVLVLKQDTQAPSQKIPATPGTSGGLTWTRRVFNDGYRHNLLPNPTGTNVITGWLASGPAGYTNARQTALSGFDRATGLRLTNSTTAGNQTVYSAAFNPGFSLAGMPFTGHMQYRSSIATTATVLYLVFYNSANVTLGNISVSQGAAAAGTVYKKYVSGVAPPGTAIIRVAVAAATAANNVFDVCCFRLDYGYDPTMGYADGATSGYAWDGTAGDTSSTATAGSSCPATIWTSTVPSGWLPNTAVTVATQLTNSSASSTNGYGHAVLDVYRSGLEPTTASFYTPTTALASAFIGGVTAGSDVSFLAADYNGIAGTPAAAGAGILDHTFQVPSGILGSYAGHYDVASTGALTVGMAAPSGQKPTLMGVEVKENLARSGGGNSGAMALDSRATRANPQTQHKMDYTQSDVVAAGAVNDSWQRQNGANQWNDNTVPWPMVVGASPGGRAQRSAQATIPNNYRRYEFVPNHRRFYPGDVVWFANAFRFTGISAAATNYQVIEQLRQDNSQGSPVLAIEVLGGNLTLTGGWGIDGTNQTRLQYMQTLLANVQPDTWYEYAYRINFSAAENTSTVDFYINGVQVLSGYVIKPPTYIDEGTYRKLGIYHDAANPGGTVYHSGTAMGLSADYVGLAVTRNASGGGNAGTLALNIKGVGLAHRITFDDDSLKRRLVDELNALYSWATIGGPPRKSVWVGEWGAVTNLPVDRTKYDGLTELALTYLDYLGIRWIHWASGRGWGTGYPLGLYVSSVIGGALDTVQAGLSTVIESHPTWGATGGFAVNLSGLENGVGWNGGGTVRTAPLYTPNGADLAALAGRGVRLIRLPVSWERLQPALMGALDSTYLATIDAVVTAARNAGIAVLLNVHNYGRYTAVDGSVYALVEAGSDFNTTHLVDLWTRLSAWVRADPLRFATISVYGIMNEPHDLAASGTRSPAQVWEYASSQTVDAIRAAGDNTTCLVGTYQGSSLQNVANAHPAGGWLTQANVVYEVHWYWDSQSKLGANSGTYQQDNGSGGLEILRYETERTSAVNYYRDIGAQMGAIRDDWTQGIRRAAGQLWAESYDGGGGNPALAVVTLGDGSKAVAVSAIAGNQYSGLRTAAAWRLSPGRIRVKVPKVLTLNGGTAVETRMIIDGDASVVAGGTRYVMTYRAETNQIECRTESGYYDPNPVRVNYSATQHLWWAIRVDDDLISFETSPDGWTWTPQRALPVAPWLRTYKCRLTLEATRDAGTVDTAQFAYVNIIPGIAKTGYGRAEASGFLFAQRGISGGVAHAGGGRAPASGFTYLQRGYGSQSTRSGGGRAPATMTYDQRGVRAGVAKAGNGRATGWTDLQRAVGAKAVAVAVSRPADTTLTLGARATGMQVRPGFGNAGVLPLGAIRGLGQPRRTGAGLAPALPWGNTWGRGSYSTRTGAASITGLAWYATSGGGGRLAAGSGRAPASGFAWDSRARGQKQISRLVRAADVTLGLTTTARGSAARTGRGLAPAMVWDARGVWAGQARVGRATAYGLQNFGRSDGPKRIFGRGRAPAPVWPDGRGTGIQIRPGFGAARGLNLSARGRRPEEIPDYFPVTRPTIVWPFQQEDIRIVAQHVRTREYLHTFVPLTNAKLKLKLSGPTEITGSIEPEIRSMKGKDGRPLFKDWSTLLHFEIQGEIWGSGILQPIETNGKSISITALGVSAYPEDIPYLANWSRVNIDAFDVIQEGWRYVQSFPNSNLGVKPPRTYARLPNRLGLEPKDLISDNIQYNDDGTEIPADMTIEHYAPGKNEDTWLFLMNVEGWPWKWEGTPPVGAMDVPKAIKENASKGVRSDRRTGRPLQVRVNKSDVSLNVWDALVYLGYAGWTANSTTVGDNILASVRKEQFKPWAMLDYEGPMVGSKINEVLSSAKLDHIETSSWTDDERTDTVQNVVPVYPRIGEPRPGCKFIQGQNIMSLVDPSQMDDFGASAMWGVGNGEGARAVRRVIEDYSDPDRLRRVATYKNARIKDPGEMDRQLRVQLNSRKETLEIPSIVIKLFHPHAKLGDYWLGDDILVEGETRWWGWVAIWHRIMEMEIDARRQTATLTLRRSDSFLYGDWVESDTVTGVGGTIGEATGVSLGGGPVAQPAPPAGGKNADLAWACADIRNRLRAGGSLYEDWTFPGCSTNVRRYNDQIRAGYTGNGAKDDIIAYLQRIINANL